MPGQHLTAGATVYNIVGEKVGTLHRYDPRSGSLVVRRSVLFPRDLYVPLRAFRGTDTGGRVHLDVRTGDLLGRPRRQLAMPLVRHQDKRGTADANERPQSGADLGANAWRERDWEWNDARTRQRRGETSRMRSPPSYASAIRSAAPPMKLSMPLVCP
jgi:hypothetical protein